MTSDWLQPDQNLKLKTKSKIHKGVSLYYSTTVFIYPLFWLRTLLNLKFLVNPKSALFWDWLWLLINVPHDRYSKTHSVGLYSWCSCMDVHIIRPVFLIHVQLQSFVLNVNHKHQWFSQHYVFHVLSLQACCWVNACDPFNLICENQSVPMSCVWLYCIDILMSSNCRGLSI